MPPPCSRPCSSVRRSARPPFGDPSRASLPPQRFVGEEERVREQGEIELRAGDQIGLLAVAESVARLHEEPRREAVPRAVVVAAPAEEDRALRGRLPAEDLRASLEQPCRDDE